MLIAKKCLVLFVLSLFITIPILTLKTKASEQNQNQHAISLTTTQQSNSNTPLVRKEILEILNSPEIIQLFQGKQGPKGEQGPQGIQGPAGLNGTDGISVTPPVNNDYVGIQPVYIPSAVVTPDVGTLLSATILTADSLTTKTINTEIINISSDFTLDSSANFNGVTTLATTTITNLTVTSLTADSGAFLSEGGVWTNASSKNLKENFQELNSYTFLEKILELPIYEWNYKNENINTKHVGPLAEDFYNLFKLGGEAGNISISTIDPASISLLGVQALNKKILELESKIQELTKQEQKQPEIILTIEEPGAPVSTTTTTTLETLITEELTNSN